MEIQLSYTDLKTSILAKGLTWQYAEDVTKYYIYTADHTIMLSNIVWKAGYESTDTDIDQNTSDRTDFETNYKPIANILAIGVNNSPFAVPVLSLDGQSFTGTIAAGTTANIDFQYTKTWWTNGVNYYAVNGSIGDTVSFQIIDIDNILGLGVNTVLSQYVTNWYVMPNQTYEFTTPFAATVQEGLYSRCIYTSTGSTNVTMYVNLYTYSATT